MFSLLILLFQGSNSVFFLGVTTYFSVNASVSYSFKQLNSTAYYVSVDMTADYQNSTLFSVLQSEGVNFSPTVDLSYSYVVNYDGKALTLYYVALSVSSNSSLHPQSPPVLPPVYMPFNLSSGTLIHVIESYQNYSVESVWGVLDVNEGGGWVNVSLAEFNVTVLKLNKTATLYPYTIILNASYLDGELHYYHLHFSTEIDGRPYVYRMTLYFTKKGNNYGQLLFVIPVAVIVAAVLLVYLKRRKTV